MAKTRKKQPSFIPFPRNRRFPQVRFDPIDYDRPRISSIEEVQEIEPSETINYLVGDGDSPFKGNDVFIVPATSKQEAIEKYIEQVEIHLDVFLENLYAKSVNMSFAEHFWLQTRGEQEHFMYHEGEYRTTEEEFKQRVRAFFGEHVDFAELYLDWYFDEESESKNMKFPKEMLLYVRHHLPSWSNLRAVRLDSIRVLV